MKKLIGDKKSFAIDISILNYEPSIWGKSCIWINNDKLGDFEDENVLAPFIGSLMRIAIGYQELWYDEFEGLECEALFNEIFPFYNRSDDFYALTSEEQKYYTRYDIFIFEFGENFDNWMVTSVVTKNICKFLWVDGKEIGTDKGSKRIKCFDVPLEDVQKVYKELCKLIPDKYWPTLIEKLQ